MRLARLFCLALLGLPLVTAPLLAQTLRGRVLSADSGAVANAVVMDTLTRRSVRADSSGVFALALVNATTAVLVTSAVGYRPDTLRIALPRADTAELRIRLRAVPTLGPRIITGWRSQLPRVADREARGLGEVLYAEEIMALGRFNATDVVRFSPRLGLVAGNRPLLFVDGHIVPDKPWKWEEDYAIKHLVPPPEDIAAVEVHRGFAGMRETDIWWPLGLPYSTSRRIIFIWTKRYVERQAALEEAWRPKDPR